MSDDQRPKDDPITSELLRTDPSFTGIVVDFVDGLSRRVGDMESALRKGDFATLQSTAHQLKGTGGSYGYPSLAERAVQLETHAKRQALDECMDTLAEIKALVARVIVGP